MIISCRIKLCEISRLISDNFTKISKYAIFPTPHPSQVRPFKPRQLNRGGASRHMVENDFRFSRGTDKLWIDEGEVRIWVSTRDVGMLVGYRHQRKDQLQEEFGVQILVPKTIDGDETVGIIIQSDNADKRNACKGRFLR